MKKIITLILMVTMIATFVGCSKKDNTDTNPTPTDTTDNGSGTTNNETDTTDEGATEDLSGTIAITGSTSVEKILNDMINEFTAYNPDVKINYTGTGSSAGISDAIAGTNDIGASSRGLKDEEKSSGLKEVTFAYDGIAVIVNPANPVADITLADLSKIYSGEITNWSELGGNDADIIVVSREGASGTRGAFEELIKLEDAGGLNEDATVVEGNGNVQATVAGNENSIGYVSFSFIDETVKALTVEGIVANADNAKAGTYKLSRPFLFVYQEGKATPVTEAFLEFSTSAEAQEFVAEHGGIRVD
jgi:phosphate transport system substrate-binding protein